jgi:hypothetical protein
MPPPDFLDILRTLCLHGVNFIVVGGVSAVLQGAPVNTFDIDIVHARDEANITRLIAALEEMEAIYRLQPERRLSPGLSHLSSPGHQLLMTKSGPLDVLGAIGRSRSYEDLLPGSTEIVAEAGVRIRVLDLATQIAVKEEVGARKDIAMLPILRRTLEERERRKR